MRPRKRFSQNFLINKRAAIRIASLLDLTGSVPIIEIGAGRGDLTRHLLEGSAHIYAVEIDRDLVKTLREQFSDKPNLTVVDKDVLKIAPEKLGDSPCYCVIGNIPYSLTTPIIEWIIKYREWFPTVVLMMQKEVASRICAQPESKDFGSLTVFVQLFYAVEPQFDLRPGSFFPSPQVNSTVIKMERLKRTLIEEGEYAAVRRLTAACFRWRRKQLGRILRDEYKLDVTQIITLLRAESLDPTLRPEQLPVGKFVSLARRILCTKGSAP